MSVWVSKTRLDHRQAATSRSGEIHQIAIIHCHIQMVGTHWGHCVCVICWEGSQGRTSLPYMECYLLFTLLLKMLCSAIGHVLKHRGSQAPLLSICGHLI